MLYKFVTKPSPNFALFDVGVTGTITLHLQK